MNLFALVLFVLVGSIAAQTIDVTPTDDIVALLHRKNFTGEIFSLSAGTFDINSTIVLLGQVTIVGTGDTLINFTPSVRNPTFYISGASVKVTFKNLSFKGGFTVAEVRSRAFFVIENCTFDNVVQNVNSILTQVLETYQSNITISDSTFLNNMGHSIYAYHGSLTLQNSFLSDTTFTCGGIGPGGLCYVINCVINDSAVMNSGSVLTVANTIFRNNSWTAISISRNDAGLIMENVTIEARGTSAAIDIQDSKVLPNRISNVRVYGDLRTIVRNRNSIVWLDNVVVGEGGQGLLAEGNSTTFIRNSLFQGNRAAEGASITLNGRSQVEIADTRFTNNTATNTSGLGGIIKGCSTCRILIYDSELQGNNGATEQILSRGGELVISNTIIDQGAGGDFCCSAQVCSYPPCDSTTCPNAQGCVCPFSFEPGTNGNISTVVLECTSTPSTPSPTLSPTLAPTSSPDLNVTIIITITITVSIENISSLDLNALVQALAELLGVTSGDITINIDIIITSKRAISHSVTASISKSVPLSEINTTPAKTQTAVITSLFSPTSHLSTVFSSANATITAIPLVESPSATPSPSPSSSPSTPAPCTPGNQMSNGSKVAWSCLVVGALLCAFL